MTRDKSTVSVRYPYTGDVYVAEGSQRIRVVHGQQWGYFDDCGRWLGEGSVRFADPCFCRFMSSSWLIENDPARWGVPPLAIAGEGTRAESPVRKRSAAKKRRVMQKGD
jgi:hypothetical protein